jgi:hypothetical protein
MAFCRSDGRFEITILGRERHTREIAPGPLLLQCRKLRHLAGVRRDGEYARTVFGGNHHDIAGSQHVSSIAEEP